MHENAHRERPLRPRHGQIEFELFTSDSADGQIESIFRRSNGTQQGPDVYEKGVFHREVMTGKLKDHGRGRLGLDTENRLSLMLIRLKLITQCIKRGRAFIFQDHRVAGLQLNVGR